MVLPEDQGCILLQTGTSGAAQAPGGNRYPGRMKGIIRHYLPYIGRLVWEGTAQGVPFQPQLFQLQPFQLVQLRGGPQLRKMGREPGKETPGERDTWDPAPQPLGPSPTPTAAFVCLLPSPCCVLPAALNPHFIWLSSHLIFR